jgi:hypothetical protein
MVNDDLICNCQCTVFFYFYNIKSEMYNLMCNAVFLFHSEMLLEASIRMRLPLSRN